MKNTKTKSKDKVKAKSKKTKSKNTKESKDQVEEHKAALNTAKDKGKKGKKRKSSLDKAIKALSEISKLALEANIQQSKAKTTLVVDENLNNKPQKSTEIAECNIRFSTEMSSNSVAPNVPWLTIPRLGTRRVLPVVFGVNRPHTPVGYPLFRPTRTNKNGFLTFKYIGKKPIYTTIKGSMTLLLRECDMQKFGSVDLILFLVPVNPSKSEMGQNSGKKALAASKSIFEEPKPLLYLKGLNDLPFPITQEALSFIHSDKFTNLYVGSDKGYIPNTGDTTLEQLELSDAQGNVGDEVRTTKWINIAQRDNALQRYIMVFDRTVDHPKSSRSRIQIKDKHGNISVYKELSGNMSSYRIYRFPKEARQVRIYYSGRGDTVDDATIRFGALPYTHTDRVDPLAGKWTQRTLSINKDVVFYPNTEYFFELKCFTKGQATVKQSGFRFQSGGMSFMFDIDDIRHDFIKHVWDQ